MRKALAVASIATVATLVAACGSSNKTTSGNTTSTPGGSSTSSSSSSASAGDGKPITIGVITSLTGAAASGFTGTEAGVKAAVGEVNAKGGVNGHMIKYEMLDDASTAEGAAAAVRKGVQQDHDFGLLSISSSFYGGFKLASQYKEPVVGSGFDGGPEWLDTSANPTLSDVESGVNYTKAPTTWGLAFKQIGATKVGGIGYIESPSASLAQKGGVASAVAAGLTAGYQSNVHFGTTDVGAQVIGLKNSSTDGLYMPTIPNTAFAVAGGLGQAGYHLKAFILATGYGGDLLQSKEAVAAGEGDYYFSTAQAPVELNTPATQRLVNDLKTYASASSEPGFSTYQGYSTAQAFIFGLGLAGTNPTQSAFVSNLRSATWDGAGLTKSVVFAQVGAAGAGMGPDNCIYLPQLKGGKFVVDPALNPICGGIVPNVTLKP